MRTDRHSTTIIIVSLLLLLSSRSSDAATLGVAWDPPTDGVTTGYIVRYGTTPGTYTHSINVGMTTSYSINTLADGVTYYFAVQGYNASGQYGPLSTEVAGTTRPAAPLNLAAAVNGTSATLTWQAPGGTVTGYRIEVGTGPGQSNVTTINTGVVTTYTINSLPAGTYYLRVRALNTAGASNASNEVAVTLAATVNPPSGLAATVRNNQYVDLTWQAAAGTVTGYRVEVGTGTGLSNVTTVTLGNVTSYTILGLTPGTYYIRVRALNGTAVSAPSNEATAALATANPPSNLTATVRNNQYVDLAWSAPFGAVTGYRIEVGTGPGQSNVSSVNVGVVTTHTVSGLVAGTYYIRVRTLNNTLVSSPSNEVSATLGSTTVQPPSNLGATVRDGVVLELTWAPPATAVQSYRVDIGSSPGLNNVRSTLVSGGTANYTASDLRGGPYYARVRSVQGTDVSSPSNEVHALLAPSAPTNFTASVNKKRYVDLAWQAPSTGASSYSVEIGTATGLSNVRTVTTDATFLTIADLPNGTYYLRVRGMNTAGLGSPSSEARVSVTRGGKPLAPSNLTATAEGSSITLSWTAQDEDAQFYRVELGTAPAKTDVSSFTTGETTNFTISELPARTYYVRVRSANDRGLSESSNEVVVAGVGGNDAPRRLSAVANGNGAVRLVWDPPLDPTGVTGYVVEAGSGPGRTDLGTVPTNGRSLSAGPLPSGTYFVRVRSLTAAGPGSASNEVALSVGQRQQCTSAPAAPRLTANVIGSLLELSWSPGIGDAPTGYLLDVGTSPGRRDIASLPLDADVTTLTTEAPNGTYALRLTAVNGCGQSAWGSDVTVTIGGGELALPGAPSSLVHQVQGRSATLTWAPAIDGGEATSYTIEVLGDNGQVILSLNTGNVSTTFTHGDVPPGQYTVRVRGVNARGAGEASNSVVVTVQ